MAPLLALLAGGKGKPMGKPGDDSGMPMDEPSEPSDKTFAGDAFDALKDGDREGFISAFLQAVRSCSSSDAPEPDADDEG